MLEFIAAHGLAMVLAEMAVLFLVFSVWEGRCPYVSPPGVARQEFRQITNLSLFAFNQFVLYGFRWLLVGWFAVFQTTGLLESATISETARLVIGVVLLDATSYLRHRIMHWRWFWPFHAVHHSDEAMDWTTEFRFHPVESLVSASLQVAVVLLCGIPGLAVILFSIIVLPFGCLQHSNVNISPAVDGFLAKLFITPGLHRVHHAQENSLRNRNFGVILPWWDWLFRTWQRPNDEKEFGITELSGHGPFGPKQVLLMPFRYPPRN